MTFFALFASFALGLFHGRLFGGFLAIRGGIMRATPIVWAIPSAVTLDWWQGVAMAILSVVQWNDGHRFDRPWRILTRYGLVGPIGVGLVTGFWWVLLIGPISASAAALFRIFALPSISTPFDIQDDPDTAAVETQLLLDGWAAYWEALTRGMGALGWTAAALYGGRSPLFDLYALVF
jgi:hypothetical protein